MLIIYFYFNDLIYTINDVHMFNDFKTFMMIGFDHSDLGLMHYFIGIEAI